jgi:NADPH:quinone reductase-like Zn-dependent oxidoreductase
MRAVVYTEYGTPDVLELQEIDTPTIKDGELLVRVHASSINSWDWDLLRGTPWYARIGGMRTPQYPVLGADIAGVVEAVGKDVERFEVGDEVFGDLSASGWGGFAEYTAAREKALAPKPASMTFEQAASIPQAGVLALQGLRDKRTIEPGQKVLINGAGGGTGTFGVQIAMSYGAEVTGVDSNAKLDMLTSMGVDHVIDYTKEDFTRNGERYDLILDVVANRSTGAYKRSLTPDGVCVVVGGTTATLLRALVLAGRRVTILAHKPNATDLDLLAEMVDSGSIVPVIDRRFELNDTAEALRYFGGGAVQGKVVITS